MRHSICQDRSGVSEGIISKDNKRMRGLWYRILLVLAAVACVLFGGRAEKEYCLCGSPRYHAPCLIDLKTGETVTLELYFPHPTKVAELTEDQPRMGTFSLIRLGDVTGTRETDLKRIVIGVPSSEKTAVPPFAGSVESSSAGYSFGDMCWRTCTAQTGGS